VWGGQIPTMNTALCLSSDDIDYIIMGEGEITWLEFVQKLENSESPNEIDGIAYNENWQIIITKCRDFAVLKELPIIDWTIVNPAKYYQKYFYSDKMLYLFSSKGCPCNCSFCGNREYHLCTYRMRPVDMTIEEIEKLIDNYALNGVYFSDEIWRVRKEDAYEFCRKVNEKNLNFVWGCDSRIGQYNREDLQMMYDAKCRWILFGIESGSKSMLEKIHKGISIEDVEENVRNCKEIGITPITTFIIGFPGETEEQVKQTVDLAMRIRSKLVQINHYFPMPGSELQRELVESGKYKAPETLTDLSRVIAQDTLEQNFSEVPSKDLRVIRCFFQWVAFTGKDTINQDSSFAFAWQAISDMFSVITKKGILFFVAGVFTVAKEFLYIFWHVIAYPGVRKKYGLFIRDKQ
ncbi:MAG: radical SAM protein, partial [Eubacteriales bacterium]